MPTNKNAMTRYKILDDLLSNHIQKELKAVGSYTDFEVLIRPTTDFKAHLISRGGWLQVVSPKSLAKEILEWHQETIDRYAKGE